MFGKWGLFVLAALASAAVLTSSAGAVSQGSAGVNVSTRAGVVQYLASLGVSARGVVIQRGAHNYAGTNCPGKGWTCTTAKRVAPDRERRATATTASSAHGGTSSGPGQCQIFQFGSGGASNNARCVEQSGDARSTDQNCSITQNSSTGSNNAQIQQQVDTNDGSTQFAHQYGGVRQNSSSGRNNGADRPGSEPVVEEDQRERLQQQNGHQEASVDQSSDTGDNNTQINQSLALQADAKNGTTINQLQNTDGNVNSNTAVDQSSNSGRNNAQVDQRNHYDAHVGKATTANQQQGSSGASGEAVFFNQNSTGLSTVQATSTSIRISTPST